MAAAINFIISAPVNFSADVGRCHTWPKASVVLPSMAVALAISGV